MSEINGSLMLNEKGFSSVNNEIGSKKVSLVFKNFFLLAIYF